jgi:hypothetical protein
MCTDWPNDPIKIEQQQYDEYQLDKSTETAGKPRNMVNAVGNLRVRA